MRRTDYNAVLSVCQSAFMLLSTVDVEEALSVLDESGPTGQHDLELLEAALPLAQFAHQLLTTPDPRPASGPDAEPGHG